MKTLILALAPAVLVSGAAFAGPQSERIAEVSFPREALYTPAGQARILERIERAAAEVCEAPAHERRTAAVIQETRRCERRAVAEAVEQLETRTAELERAARIRIAGQS